jgi:hypothetical protein
MLSFDDIFSDLDGHKLFTMHEVKVEPARLVS